MKEYLPIGSVVNVKLAGDMNFMIVGLLAENSNKERRDYVAVRYPVGILDNSKFYFIDHEDISKIVFRGYDNEDHKSYVELLNSMEKYLDKEVKE